jgi:DNA sulfur modification protein DndC
MARRDVLRRTVRTVKDALMDHPEPWIVGFSGGKDSSCVVKIVFQALVAAKSRKSSVTVLYCDTGVEIPPIRRFVWQTLTGLAIEAEKAGIPLRCDVATPRLEDRFFFKVIGRGYVPPTNKFRWCTDRLRIRPIQSFIKELGDDSKIIALGLRRGESNERDRTIARHRTEQPFYSRQEGSRDTLIYTPILNYSLKDVWHVLANDSAPSCIDGSRLRMLYRYANGECPIIRDATATPCAGSRFGCWTCTVVRKDRAMEGLIKSGHHALQPLLDFRNWLNGFRNDRSARWLTRRNGATGPGPFSLEARQTILRRLLAAQRAVGFQLIGSEEVDAIKSEWIKDRTVDSEMVVRCN